MPFGVSARQSKLLTVPNRQASGGGSIRRSEQRKDPHHLPITDHKMDPIQYQGILDAINAQTAAINAVDIVGFAYILDAIMSAWAFIIGIHVVNS